MQDIITQVSLGVELNVQQPKLMQGEDAELAKTVCQDAEICFHGGFSTKWCAPLHAGPESHRCLVGSRALTRDAPPGRPFWAQAV